MPGAPVSRSIGAVTLLLKVTGIIILLDDPVYGTV
jgi:hypothetical protein